MRKAIFIFLMFLLSTYPTIGQEGTKAVLVDEFDGIQCGELLARTDQFLQDLLSNSDNVGYALISNNGRNPKGFYAFINATLYYRQFDRSRMKIAIVDNRNNSNGYFWRVPQGAEPPDFDEIVHPQLDTTKPLVFGNDFTDNVCPSFSPDLYVKLIKKYPGSIARIEIAGRNWRERQGQAEYERSVFVEKLGLSEDRISFYFIHRPKMVIVETKYIFIPPK